MLPQETLDLAEHVLNLCRAKNLRIATAESCTGGLIAAALTHIPGSSDVFERGYVTYSNEAKAECLGVPPDLIAQHGAVSQAVASAMAEGALKFSRAHLALSVTGIAGPGGATPEKPVGLVWFALATSSGKTATHQQIFNGDRAKIRAQAAHFGIKLLEQETEL